MKVYYFVGFSSALPKDHPALGWNVRELVSFWDWRKSPSRWERAMNRPDVFLDSGAFSAWTRGVPIDLNEYIRFVHSVKERITVYANLDIIGDPKGTWENQKEMERQGLKPLPVFHTGKEQLSWLKKIADEYEYFGLGGMAGKDITTSQIVKALDQVFSYLADAKGRIKHRVHGFGITTMSVMLRFPFYSLDSTSWVLQGRFGGIFIRLGDQILTVSVSDRSPDRKKAGAHYRTLSRLEQKEIERVVSGQGFTMEQVAESYQARDCININFFLELERTWKPVKFNPGIVQGGFF